MTCKIDNFVIQLNKTVILDQFKRLERRNIMKRILFVFLALLIALAIVSCDLTTPQEPDFYVPTPGTSTTSTTRPQGSSHTHAYGDWVVVKNATSTETGLMERTCSCGAKETKVIEVSQNELEFALVENGSAYEVVGIGTVEAENIVVPSEYNNKPVIGIGNGAFYRVGKIIKTVTLPNTIQYIGYDAFRDCTWLESINLPSSLTSMGTRAFYGCKRLKEISIPESLSVIEDNTFYQCEQLEKVTLHENITSIGEETFSGCISLKSIDLTSKITSLKYSVFEGCTALETVVLPDSLESIENRAFKDCVSLREINAPAFLVSIGEDIFNNCASLKSFAIPSGVTEIPSGAFYKCASLDGTVTIAATVTKIGTNAFYYCSSLDHIVFEENSQLTAIEKNAFYGCAALSGISIGDGEKIEGSFVLPSALEQIGESAFSGCESMKSIVIPASVTFIERYAFSGCTSLEAAHFVNTVNWKRAAKSHINDSYYSYVSVSSNQISDAELMASYVTGNYCDNKWSNYD